MGIFYTHRWSLELPDSFIWLQRGPIEVVPAVHLSFGWLKVAFRHTWAQNPELHTISVTALRNRVTHTHEQFYGSHGLIGR